MKQELLTKDQIDLEQVAIDYLKATGLNLSQQNEKLFIMACKEYKLNPTKKEIYAVPYKTKEGLELFSTPISYEVYLKRADESGKVEYLTCGVEKTSDNMLYGWAELKRTDRTKPISIKCWLNEYSTGKSKWLSAPKTMIEKCAIARVCRLSFPNQSLPYIIEEMGFANTGIENEQTTDKAPKKIGEKNIKVEMDQNEILKGLLK